MTHELLIITCRHDSRLKVDKELLKLRFRELDLEIIRVERAKWK